MSAKYFFKHKSSPLTEDKILERYKEIQEEMQEVLEWKAEEEAKLKDSELSPQRKGAAKRALKKIAWRIDSVQGQIIYWKLRVNGESHFKASLEKNEYWAECKKHRMEE